MVGIATLHSYFKREGINLDHGRRVEVLLKHCIQPRRRLKVVNSCFSVQFSLHSFQVIYHFSSASFIKLPVIFKIHFLLGCVITVVTARQLEIIPSSCKELGVHQGCKLLIFLCPLTGHLYLTSLQLRTASLFEDV